MLLFYSKGDHPVTAEKIAKSVGILSKKERVKHFGFHENSLDTSDKSAVIDGNFLAGLSETDLDRLLRKYKEIVFARTTPLQKELVVRGYQRLGEFVCATGDGVNDCACLKQVGDIYLIMKLGKGQNETIFMKKIPFMKIIIFHEKMSFSLKKIFLL